MATIVLLLFMVGYAFLNRCRGTHFFNRLDSTFDSRLLATVFMAMFVAFYEFSSPGTMSVIMLYSWVMLMLWCTPAWDKYWSAAIGHDPKHCRLWGLGMMTLRMTLAMPFLIGIAFLSGHPDNVVYAAGAMTLGFPYYFWGYAAPKNPVGMAEYTVGAILGGLACLAIGG